ncbi:MDMPI C-terminal domain-containing protein [Streptoalloteichus hindustanus]|uniref:MDMPI C-terminal domain-containing protein n=2 Tax=Streptoalloteichus hindustanus TaxID=2017 RepID=A0A1M4U9M9_STRHI|nr:MDMPI C-terminal domain-containing protein [Streptoalloteichus hindustanus]
MRGTMCLRLTEEGDVRTVLGVQRWLSAFDEQSRMFRDVVREVDPETMVPSCPPWTFGQLTMHVGRFLQTVSAHVRSGSQEPMRPDPLTTVPDPVGFLDEQVADVREVLGSTPGNRPVWTFSPAAPRLAWFWHRRVAHEMALRRWDAHSASRSSAPLSRDLALDGVDEALGTLLAAKQAVDSPLAVSGTALVVCDDGDETWRVRFVPGEVPEVRQVKPGATVATDARASGRASHLYLALWGRVPLNGEGDPAILAALRLR